jgi:low temperature requirement protein LtrA
MKQNARSPIQLRQDEREEGERRATWLELFYDLIFVAAIGELTHSLSAHLDLKGLSDFIILFVPIWWCWIGSTFYATRFDHDSTLDRFLTLIQMAIVATMAVNIHHGLQESATNFALCYAAFRGLLVVQYLYAGYHVPIARRLTSRYALGFGLSVLLWIVSIFVSAPGRFWLWGIGLCIDLATPLTAGKLVAEVPPSTTHIPERVGLFTIVVLGEAIISVVQGLSKVEWGISTAITALLGLSVAFSLWWLYFDTTNGSPLQGMKQGKMGVALTWLYIHLPLTMSITATAAGIGHLIAKGTTQIPSGIERWLFCNATAIALVCLAAIHWFSCTLGTPKLKTIVSAYRLGSVLFIILIAIVGQSLSGTMVVALVAMACGIQVILNLLRSSRRSRSN